MENGHSPEENQVSRTSSSCLSSFQPQKGHFSGFSTSTTVFPHASQWYAGILCPHQICREMHQSRMFSIHSK